MLKNSSNEVKKKFVRGRETGGTVLRYSCDHLPFRSPTADSVACELDARGEGQRLTAVFKTDIIKERNLHHLCHGDIDDLMFWSVVVLSVFKPGKLRQDGHTSSNLFGGTYCGKESCKEGREESCNR